jgi:hypothetical protein
MTLAPAPSGSAPEVFSSTELRWFRRGTLPFRPTALFPREPPSLGERPDHYLLSRDPGLGLKIRGGGDRPRLETKVRMSSEPWTSGACRGRREGWRKWSWVGPGLPDPSPEADPWVTVRKRRYLWTLEWRGGALRFVPTGTRVAMGASIEATGLEAGGDDAWTLGVEAFGIGDESDEIVDRAAALLLEATGLTLDASESFGYPTWLMGVVGG